MVALKTRAVKDLDSKPLILLVLTSRPGQLKDGPSAKCTPNPLLEGDLGLNDYKIN